MSNGEINRRNNVLEEVTALEGIGPILKRVREEKNISLEEIAEATKIRVKYLEAIENEQFDLLPGAVYAKGFVNTYIRYLNIGDWPEVVEIMQHSVPRPSAVPIVPEEPQTEAEHHLSRSAGRAKLEDKPITSKKYLIIGISVAAILALLAIQTIYNKQQPPDEDSIVIPPQTDQVADNDQPEGTDQTPSDKTPDTPDSTQPEQTPAQSYDGLELKLQIIDLTPTTVDKCWTTVSADGKAVFTETLNEGALKTITADKTIHIKVGNGGVCKLTLNGQDLGIMGEKGQVVEKTFNLEDLQKTVTSPATVSTPNTTDTNDEQ